MSDFLNYNLSEEIENQKRKTGGLYVCLPFVYKGKFLNDAVDSAGEIENTASVKRNPVWGMSLLKAGSMRFRWNDTNENRKNFLAELCSDAATHESSKESSADENSSLPSAQNLTPVSLELIHSKTVYLLNDGTETFERQGDGMITKNPALLPVVTVADCVPIFFYDVRTGYFGLVHSGWKGTGIIASAIELAVKTFGTRIEDVCVAIGPHIGECCYTVDSGRAQHFAKNFGPDCVTRIPGTIPGSDEKFSLSLTKANLAVLNKCGVKAENIIVCADCTCCARFGNTTKCRSKNAASGDFIYGSFRRQAAPVIENQTASGNPLAPDDVSKVPFTVQAAFCGYL